MNKPAARSSRSIAREKALQALYQVDIADADPKEALSVAWGSDEEAPAPESDALQFSEDLVMGVLGKRADLDAAIGKNSRNWRVERMSRIDRNILRLAVFELTRPEPLPSNIILNEAVELAKRFGSVESRAFINGILDAMVKAASAHGDSEPCN